MGKDLNTTIAGVVAFIAIIINWVMSFFGMSFQIPVEVQGAIVGLAVLVIGYYVGKPGEPTSPSP